MFYRWIIGIKLCVADGQAFSEVEESWAIFKIVIKLIYYFEVPLRLLFEALRGIFGVHF